MYIASPSRIFGKYDPIYIYMDKFILMNFLVEWFS